VVELRIADVDDLAAVLDVWAAADAEPTITDDEDSLHRLLADAPESLVLAMDRERVVGTLIMGWDGWRSAFYRLAVVPDRRLEGIGRQLVAEGLLGRGARRIALFAVTGYAGPLHSGGPLAARSSSTDAGSSSTGHLLLGRGR
jgi:ribosomal protein S18 acetylase RimI-like enzyme